jgi:hypothetical protein
VVELLPTVSGRRGPLHYVVLYATKRNERMRDSPSGFALNTKLRAFVLLCARSILANNG